MKQAKCATLFFVSLIFVTFLFVRHVEACYQMEAPSVQLRSGTIVGSITLNGKPIDGAVLALHKFLGPYSIELGHADAHVLGRAVTTKDGTFSFGAVPRGKYVVFMLRPSAELLDVEVFKPKKGESDTVAIEYFADWCGSATAVSATGEKLRPRSTLAVFGRMGIVN
jgi:hypothetical protein